MDLTIKPKLMKLLRVGWFLITHPFLILKWSLVALFWACVLTYCAAANAVETAPAKLNPIPDASYKYSSCSHSGLTPSSKSNSTMQECIDYWKSLAPSWGIYANGALYLYSSDAISKYYRVTLRRTVDGVVSYGTFVAPASFSGSYTCPPDGKPTFTDGPHLENGQQVCKSVPLTCLTGSSVMIDANGKEVCQPSCDKEIGNDIDGKFFIGTIGNTTIKCYGQCVVTSAGGVQTTDLQGTNFYIANVKFTGENCPLQNDGVSSTSTQLQPFTPSTPVNSSTETQTAQNNLQQASSAAQGTNIQGQAAGTTATLNDVVNKLAEVGNVLKNSQSEQQAALGKVVEQAGKDIQSTMRDVNFGTMGGGGGGAFSQAALQQTNAIKDGNAALTGKLQEISDKLDETATTPPGSAIDADPSSVRESNNWQTRNFGTVLQANADRFSALPLFAVTGSFFNVSLSAGNCPTFSTTVELPWGSMPLAIDQFCDDQIVGILPKLAFVVLAVAGFFAFRWAMA